MQEVEESQPENRPVVLGPSLVLDLSWALHAVWKPPLQAAQPVLGKLFGERPELAQAVRGLWDDELGCLAELQILAIWAEALEVTDFDTLLSKLFDAIDTVPLDLALESEAERDREIILSRLAALRGSPRLRRRWGDVLAQVWAGLDEEWRTSSVPLIESAAVEARGQLDRGTEWLQLIVTKCETFKAHLPQILERHRAGRRVLMAPCAFFGRAMYIEMPSCILIGLGISGVDSVARARTADVARRLRVLADPTRLAILDHLADGARSVGEIAYSFSLAQPTVSTHVKHLREAGLVSAERQGTRVEVSLNRDAVQALAGELGTLLVH
ncbi:MAG: metalloregulator ArsR/SmtB family transcription factor [Acidimicrobiales bacterium]|jgi:ArsR family transcriptional regulator